MKVSVVTVCRNAADTIGYTVESFLKQSHVDKEMVVVDGQSSDATVDIVRSFAGDGIVCVCEPDGGMYEAANKGLARFSGAAVGFLNADDCFHDDDVLADVARTLVSTDIVFGGVEYVDRHDGGRVVRRWQGTPFVRGAFMRGWMPAHPSFYVRRRVAETVGPFDLSYRIAADYDWMLRACELHGFDTRLVDRTFVSMLAGGKSTANLRSHIEHNVEALLARRRWLGAGVLDAALFAKPARKLHQFLVR